MAFALREDEAGCAGYPGMFSLIRVDVDGSNLGPTEALQPFDNITKGLLGCLISYSCDRKHFLVC